MKARTILVAALLSMMCSCYSVQLPQETSVVDTQTHSVPVSILRHKPILYTMDIHNKGSYGKSFIADYVLYSCHHLFSNITIVGLRTDTKKICDIKIKGLSVCQENHVAGDFFYTVLQNGFTVICIFDKTNYYYDVSTSPGVIFGDSGSPVLCQEHNAVVGLISAVGYCRKNQAWISILIPKQTKVF